MAEGDAEDREDPAIYIQRQVAYPLHTKT